MPRRTRRRIIGKWEQIEQETREEELKELERELRGEQRRGRKPKPKQQRRRRTKPETRDAGTARDNGTDSPDEHQHHELPTNVNPETQ